MNDIILALSFFELSQCGSIRGWERERNNRGKKKQGVHWRLFWQNFSFQNSRYNHRKSGYIHIANNNNSNDKKMFNMTITFRQHTTYTHVIISRKLLDAKLKMRYTYRVRLFVRSRRRRRSSRKELKLNQCTTLSYKQAPAHTPNHNFQSTIL